MSYDQTLTSDAYPPGGWGECAPVTVVQPSFGIHNAMDIEPGHIWIAMGYGLMWAADWIVAPTPAVRQQAMSLSDRITQLRLEIWDMEHDANRKLRPDDQADYTPFPDAVVLLAVRTQKENVRELIVQRQDPLGGEPRLNVVPVSVDFGSVGLCGLGRLALSVDMWVIHHVPARALRAAGTV